jgi:hypothetical protein
MESARIIVLAGLAVLFPEYLPHIAGAGLALEVARRYRRHQRREECDRSAVELLFRLGASGELTEAVVAREMAELPSFGRSAATYGRTSRLSLPRFGWRSEVAAGAIRAALQTGDPSVVTRALEQVSRREEAMTEAQSVLASQKYTLVASIAVSSAIMGVASSISGQNYLWFVALQSLLSAVWLAFLGNGPYESLSLSVLLSLASYFLSARLI